MKIKIKKSKYYRNRKEYILKGVKKCSGFYNFWYIDIITRYTGTSYFVQCFCRNCDKKGKDLYNNVIMGIEIKKHCKTGNQAKKVMRFLYDNPIDYARDINITKGGIYDR